MFFEAELGEDCLRVCAQHVIRRLAGVDCEQDGDQATHYMGVAVALEAEHGSAIGSALCLGCEPHLAGAAADLVSVRAVGLGQGGQAPAELDDVAVAVLPVVEESEVGADRIERHPIAVRASAPVIARLQTEKLVPQPQEAVAFGFLILNDAVIRSSM